MAASARWEWALSLNNYLMKQHVLHDQISTRLEGLVFPTHLAFIGLPWGAPAETLRMSTFLPSEPAFDDLERLQA